MPFEDIQFGLNFQVPTSNTKNWATKIKTFCWQIISGHRHEGSGDGNQIRTAGIEDGAVTSPKLAANLALTQYDTVNTPAGTTQALDFNNGSIQTLDLGSATGDVTVSLLNPAKGATYKIWVIQGATPRNIVWPGSVKWPQAQAPLLSQGDDDVDLVELYYTGTEFRGQWELDFS